MRSYLPELYGISKEPRHGRSARYPQTKMGGATPVGVVLTRIAFGLAYTLRMNEVRVFSITAGTMQNRQNR